MHSPFTSIESVRKTPSREHASPRWTGFLLPSIADLFFVTLLLALSFGAFGRVLLRDADVGWHIRNGQVILTRHTITRTDPFSSMMGGHTWYAWEWLYDVAIVAIHQVAGLNGVVFFSAAIIAAAFVLALHAVLKRGGNLVITFVLLILSLAASSVHFLARPHLLTWLFAVIWFELLDSAATRKNDRRVFWLPALMILWVNVHGGFVLGFAMLGIYLAGGAIQYFAHPKERSEMGAWLKRLGIVTAVSAAASFVNPYGYHLQAHVYHYLTDRLLMSQISEFLSPDFHGAAQQCFAVLLIVAIVAMASVPDKFGVSRLLLLLFAAYSGLYATRNLPTSSLLITLLIAPALSSGLRGQDENPKMALWLKRGLGRVSSFGVRMQALERSFRGHAWVLVALAVGLWACLHGGRLGSAQVIRAQFDANRFPVQAVDYIAEQHVPGPIFSLDYWGGYLIYRLYPETKVVLDDRHDFYGDRTIKDYLKIVLVRPTYQKELDAWQVDWVLVPRWSSLANTLGLNSNWKIVYEDDTAALFRRKS